VQKQDVSSTRSNVIGIAVEIPQHILTRNSKASTVQGLAGGCGLFETQKSAAVFIKRRWLLLGQGA